MTTLSSTAQRLLLAAVVLGLSAEAHAGESYYLLMFGSQRMLDNPNYSHTFATFVRASWPGDGPCPSAPVLEVVTISWMPDNFVIRALALQPERGRNLELHETLHYARDSKERVSMWGPYQIEPELYQRAQERYDLLTSGNVRYKSNDTGYHSNKASNCVHAVSSIADGGHVCILTPGWGEPGTHVILRRFKPWILERNRIHPWVATALGLNDFPLIHRDVETPGFWGKVRRLFGAEHNPEVIDVGPDQ